MKPGNDILFRTSRFNLSEEMAHFINPCCFGEDLASWLRTALSPLDYQVTDPGQEDWGWYVEASKDGKAYFLGIGGESDGNPSEPNLGEWRLIVERRRSIKDRLFRRGQEELALVPVLLELLRREPDFADVRMEENP